jgi:C-terminal processing protease CtpA/Prc
LADELSVSNADIVPNVLKVNDVAPIFGQRTMGGGGNVEVVATLSNTQAQLHLSRGLFTVYDPTNAYPESTFIEDNGVVPDVSYSHTLADFRAGYVGYVAAFNSALSRQFPK